MTFDILIKNGRIIDGSGAPAFTADIGIRDGKIAAYGSLTGAEAGRVMEAEGYTVTPGFIDIHRHADAAVFRDGFGEAELAEGLTTIVNGNCGLSVAPVGEGGREEIFSYLEPITGRIGEDIPTGSMGDYLSAVAEREKSGLIPLNTRMLAGAGTIRAAVAGYHKLRLDDSDYSRIHGLISDSLEAGALGVSLGLGYAPECFYTTEELIRALQPVAGSNIPVTVHMRQEGAGVCESVAEMIAVGKALNCPMHISHLKAMGKKNWNSRIPEALGMIERALAEGLDISCDVYPYTAGSTQLMHILPPEFLEGGIADIVCRLRSRENRKALDAMIRGEKKTAAFDNIAELAGWDGIYVTSVDSSKNRECQGKNIDEIANIRGCTPLDACCDLLIEENCHVTMIDFMACEEDIERILNVPCSSLISDATYPTAGLPHPRVYGSCTRLIEHFVLERRSLSLEKAVNKLTLAPAEALRLTGKGLIKEGFDADLCIFKPEELHENASYADPRRNSSGMKTVIVNGIIRL